MPEKVPKLLNDLWRKFDFAPTEAQRNAILHHEGPLFLPAGPGSGKTRVLLWRCVNLITTHNVSPDKIFLSTFTEKAALQLKNGLCALLSVVSEETKKPYDTANLYVGTVHSLCQRILMDRRFSRTRTKPPILLDELGQYMLIRKEANWKAILNANEDLKTNSDINRTFGGGGKSRHDALMHLLRSFNRFSEEMIDPVLARKTVSDSVTKSLLDCYKEYLQILDREKRMDLAMLQQVALKHLQQTENSGHVFEHVIVDEYQDTNPIQEQIFFNLAKGSKNLCVVGDDDQALYRFRGATVENFVEFPDRCEKYFNIRPKKDVLSMNYRSREDIISFFNRFIKHESCDWRKNSEADYRVGKKITPCSGQKRSGVAVVASTPSKPEEAAEEIAKLVKQLIVEKKVEDPNQVAFLFPSLKSPHVERLKIALSAEGLDVYAPRAGTFLDMPEAKDVFGILFQVMGVNAESYHNEFKDWCDRIIKHGSRLMSNDKQLKHFVEQRKTEISQIKSDFEIIEKALDKNNWSKDDAYNPDTMPAVLAAMPRLSAKCRKALTSWNFDRFARERVRSGNRPFTLGYAITRATSVDWNVLDLFYQLAGFKHFSKMFDLAEKGVDEGPTCNLGLISQYLADFIDHYPFPISGKNVKDSAPSNLKNYLYILYRRAEFGYEDANDPFPKGRIPFITIHQAKGLEFPVVVLANPRKDPELQKIEEVVAPLLGREGEPLDRMPTFDVMRMFYVALSRAKNLLVIAHYKGQGQRQFEPFRNMLNESFPRIKGLDISSVPVCNVETQDLPESYSYTGDYLLYQKCPRQYMLFRKYGFVPSRAQTMLFGSLVHQTLEDLHHHFIDQRGGRS